MHGRDLTIFMGKQIRRRRQFGDKKLLCYENTVSGRLP
jgi:hypothetical protein